LLVLKKPKTISNLNKNTMSEEAYVKHHIENQIATVEFFYPKAMPYLDIFLLN